ncbi:unnamed protein product [Triticum turgidum subsp. durum]|uniref:DUF7731 domain-containing protein n=1 Tax=Triticum turgidum subsp. durum TaxID=4567 RepID=A0A9R0Q7K8_TRITD|nr:unnamed protein product [Triticum turgidum subsp. durum]
MASFKLVHLCFTAVLLCVAFSCCRGQGGGGGGAGAGAGAGGGGGSGIGAVVPGTQDSVQIVAQAALCFDNRPVLTGCLQAMGINASSGTGASMPPPAPGGAATAIMCSPPCFGHVTMMMSCVNAIFGNFVSYNPGLMQGVQAVFQMSCGNVNGPGGAGGAPGGGMGGGPAGNAGGGAAGGGMGGGPAGNAGGASGGVGGGAAGGIPNGIGGPGGIPNSMGGAAGGGGGASGASGGGASGTTNTIGGAAGGGAGGTSGGAGGGNDTTNGGAATGAIGSGNITSVSPNAGSHVAVSNQSQPTSGADGPTLSLKGGCSSAVLAIWAGAWLVLF